MWDPKYDVAYHVALVMGAQLVLMDRSDKIHKVNVQDVNITYLVNE